MVTTTRSYGAFVNLLVAEESVYGVDPGGNYQRVPYTSCDFGGEQGLIDSNVLGLGREPRDPFIDVLRVDGTAIVPVDVRDIGFWLKMVLGAAVVTQEAAVGTLVFAGNALAGDTITMNGVLFTFVAAGAVGNEINVGVDLPTTLTNIETVLNASVEANVSVATYSEDTIDTLTVTYDTTGPSGNAFTMAASITNGVTLSAPTLDGGAYVHTFSSAKEDLPSFVMEVGHKNIPAYHHSLGCRADSLKLNFQRTGGALAEIGLFGQNEARFPTTQGGVPTTRDYETFNQFQGSIKKNGLLLNNVVSADFTYANGMERVETIRDDALVEGIDPTMVKNNGSIDVRYGDTSLVDDAITQTPCELKLGYKKTNGKKLDFIFHQVFLSRPKMPVSGPGGVQATFDWQAVYDETAGKSVTCVLYNDVAGY